MRALISMLLVTLIAIPVGRAASQVRTWTPTYDTVGSAPRVTSGGYTAWQDSTTGWMLRPERIVTLVGDETWSPRANRQTLVLPDGRLVVSTMEPASIQLYDSSGTFVRTIGRSGNGPGEYSWPSALAVTGDTLIIHDGRQARMLLYTMSGTYLRAFYTDIRNTASDMAIDPRGYLRLRENFGMTGARGVRWIYFTLEGARVDSLERPTSSERPGWSLDSTNSVSRFIIPFTASDAEVFLDDGTLLYGTGDRFRFMVTRTGADTVRIAELTNIRVDSIPAAYADTVLTELIKAQPRLNGIATSAQFPRVFPLWNELAVDGRGYIWVSIGFWSRRTHYFGVFAPDGRYLGFVRSLFERFAGTSWSGDRVAALGVDRQRRPIVRIFTIDRKRMPRP